MNEYLKKEPEIRLSAQGDEGLLLEIRLTLQDPEESGRPLQTIADVSDERGSFLGSVSATISVPAQAACPAVLRQTIARGPSGDHGAYRVRIIVRRGGVTLDVRESCIRLEEQGRAAI